MIDIINGVIEVFLLMYFFSVCYLDKPIRWVIFAGTLYFCHVVRCKKMEVEHG